MCVCANFMLAAHTVFVRTIIKVFFMIFLKDLWMVISLQSLSFSPILLFFLCPALFVCVRVCLCVRTCLCRCIFVLTGSSHIALSHWRHRACPRCIEARLNSMRGISICLRHHFTIYCTLTTLLPLWLSEKNTHRSRRQRPKIPVVTLPHYSHYPI